MRMALDWRIEEQVNDSLVMYVHVLRDGVELVAQRDAIPGNGLFPVTEWTPGEVVRDPRHLQIAGDAPPGRYRLLAALVDPASNAEVDSTTVDYLAVQERARQFSVNHGLTRCRYDSRLDAQII